MKDDMWWKSARATGHSNSCGGSSMKLACKRKVGDTRMGREKDTVETKEN